MWTAHGAQRARRLLLNQHVHECGAFRCPGCDIVFARKHGLEQHFDRRCQHADTWLSQQCEPSVPQLAPSVLSLLQSASHGIRAQAHHGGAAGTIEGEGQSELTAEPRTRANGFWHVTRGTGPGSRRRKGTACGHVISRTSLSAATYAMSGAAGSRDAAPGGGCPPENSSSATTPLPPPTAHPDSSSGTSRISWATQVRPPEAEGA